MSFAPEAPTTRVPPTRAGTDAWVVHQVQHALGAPLSVYLNSMVIAGPEPAIVDTGSANNRDGWLEDVFTIVDPVDVRWILLSHDDSDHTGNLAAAMEACPNATLVCSWAIVERFSNAFGFPLERCRWLNDGEALDIGDRRIRAVRPPVYDSPATRGFLDERTGVYWASTRSPPPVRANRSRPSATSIRASGPRAWPCSATTLWRRGWDWSTGADTAQRSSGSRRWA